MCILHRLFTALAVVPLLFFSANAVGFAGTLAISYGTGTVCGISASMLPRTIYCTNISESVPTSPYLVYPNVSFNSLSAGTTFLCGLKSSRRVFYCWNGDPVSLRRIYRGSWVLSDLTVGATHVSAIDRSGNEIRWWRRAGLFPSSVLGNYSSLTSGNNFTCAITTNGTVTCWGPLASAVEAGFSNYSMSTIVAGDFHMCGLDSSGFVICQGSNSSGQSYAPPGLPYEYTRFALGSSHTCAVKQPNGMAVCWGGFGGAQLHTPLNDTAFEFLVAGGNLTCGLTSNNYSVLCWGSDWRNVSVITLPLLRILPGICVAGSDDDCNCGTYPDSGSLCAGTGVICQRCDNLDSIAPLPPPALPPQPSKSERIGSVWKVEAGIGSLCMIFAAIGIGWLIYSNRAQNQIPPIDPAGGNNNAAAGGDNNAAAGGDNNAHDAILSDSSSSGPDVHSSGYFDLPPESLFLPPPSTSNPQALQRQRSGPSTFNRFDDDELI